MMTIDDHLIRLQARATDKQDAIHQVGQLLVDCGYIDAGYVTSMLNRELVANTYLGNGISIPHGLPRDRELIKQTGIAVVQVPDGVTWNAGETVRLVVGIAAKSDEHIDILRRLTRVLGDQEQVARLSQTRDPRDIIEALTGERPAVPASSTDTADYANFFDAVILNKTGLHARPAATFVNLAKRFQADIKVSHNGSVANGKSLISLLQLGVEHGTTVRVSAQGADAVAALNALQSAIAVGLGDEPEEQFPPAPTQGAQGWVAQAPGATISGIAASGGLAIGPVRQFTHRSLVVTDSPDDPIVEGERLEDALSAAQKELDRLHEEVKTRLGSGKAAIFRVHAEFLNDPTLVMQTVSLIYQGHNAAWAWQQTIDERVSRMQKLDDPVLAGRAVDLSDVGQRVLRHILGVTEEPTPILSGPTILIAEDLTPSDTATLDPDAILGLCTARGGPTSHTAILARGLGLPAIVGAGEEVLDVADGTLAILDGESGKLYLKPSEADVQAARDLQQQLQRQQESALASRFAPAMTSDGYQVEVAANINRAADVPQAIEAGAEGVGLMRTEFLFLARDSAPSEDEQFEAYRAMAQALEGRPLIIRTLDIGGDKEVPYLHLPKEDNSFLGVRGIRLCLVRPDLFIPQLRAIYRAAAYGRIHIMLPMVATLEDVERARAIAEQVRQELNAP
ncbi:MAG TPA: phosphoenolpyruvate--protein phosphotransferase, partial [Ktedonobacteraceae bacterium]|nr:phosphoenolpyruvate--protein phosphotransferase [Ktedonobacteraceae bacterium]